MAKDYRQLEAMYELAGDTLSDKLNELFPNQQTALLQWFYTPIPVLNNTSPAQYCQQGKQSELENRLTSLLQGNIGN